MDPTDDPTDDPSAQAWTWKEGAGRSGGGHDYQAFDLTRMGVAVASSALTKAWRHSSQQVKQLKRSSFTMPSAGGVSAGMFGGGASAEPGPLADCSGQARAQAEGWVTLQEGWLTKRGQVMRSWKRRYFVLKLAPWLVQAEETGSPSSLLVPLPEVGGVLEYLDGEGGELKGSVLLSHLSACRNCADGSISRPDSFTVEEEQGGRALVACAPEGARERGEWVRAICGVLRRHAAAISAARKAGSRQ
jgi:hypothetical protein